MKSKGDTVQQPPEDLEWVILKQEMDALQPKATSFTEKLQVKFKQNPFIPIGLLATVLCLGFGIRTMKTGNSAQGQVLMRGRVAAQGATIAALITGMVMSERAQSS